ncbi:MAG: acyltransferase [Bacilli bacterium]|nr:acyltransferase [Bacilli bacterium]
MKTKFHIDVLDLLRFLATMFVFCLHGRGFVPELNQRTDTWIGRYFYLPAWAGVWIFLFLSGFLFALAMQNNRYGILNEKGGINFKNLGWFYLSRLIRFGGLYFFYLLLFELFSRGGFIISNPQVGLRVIFFCFDGNGGVSETGHLWYISTAIQLYVLMPFIYFGFHHLAKKWPKTPLLAFFVIMALGFAWRVGTKDADIDWYTWIYAFSLSNLDLVCCGMLLAFLLPAFSASKVHKILSALLFTGLVVYNSYIYAIGDLYIYQRVLPSAYLLLCSYLVLAFYKPVRGTGFFAFFSKYSYGFYIFHVACFHLASAILLKTGWGLGPYGATVFVYLLAFSFALGVSYFCTKYIRFPNIRRSA